jgi:Ni/Fe-hydrogenase subunit HybB-like protein
VYLETFGKKKVFITTPTNIMVDSDPNGKPKGGFSTWPEWLQVLVTVGPFIAILIIIIIILAMKCKKLVKLKKK